MKYPKFIQKGNCIGVPTPSASGGEKLSNQRLLQAEKYFLSQGFELVLSKNLFSCQMGRSASAQDRAKEINDMFSSDDVDCILCCDGGDFLVEILPFVDFSLLVSHPKFVAGFSDPTGLLYSITTKYDIATIYGHNFSNFGALELHQSELTFLEFLTGNLILQESYDMYQNEFVPRVTGLEGYQLDQKVYWNTLDEKPVHLHGRIIGGCFDIIAELAGTKYDGFQEFHKRYSKDGIIWYFDNCELTMEETIRVLWKFQELGYFEDCIGVIFGRFGKMESYYGYDTKKCLLDSVLGHLSIPVVYDADISHKGPCFTIINGSIATIDVENGVGKMSFELK